jgi:purine nucleosidase
LLRSPWFWIVVILIAIGIAAAATLGVLHWLALSFAALVLVAAITLLIAAYAVERAEPPEVPHLHTLPNSERLPVICDCDVTMGRPFREVDDGLALLYLLGEPRVNLLGVTTTYGNGPVEMTTPTARRLLDSVGRDDIPVICGAASADDPAGENEAAQYLSDVVSKRPGEITLVAAGSMTNLGHATTLDPQFFTKLRGLYLMGGVTEPLAWNGRRLTELNFALDPEAAYRAVHAECPVTITPGQAGLSAVFRGRQLAALLTLEDPVSRLIARRVRLWFALMRLYFQGGGFVMWSSVAALMLTQPGLFEYERAHVVSTRDDLRSGRLIVMPNKRGAVRIVHRVLDYDRFIDVHFTAWHHLGRQIGTRRNHP